MVCPEHIKEVYAWHTEVMTVDVGPDRLLTPTAQLRLQQEAGEKHFGEGNLGFASVADHGLAFLLCKNNAVIYRRPQALERITVKTWSYGVKGAKYFRCYRFEDEQGRTLIDSTASFVLVDVNSHALLRPSQFPYAVPHCPDQPHTCPMPPRLKAVDGMTPCGTHEVRYSQLDFNGHLNNTRYADIVFDHLPAQTVETMTGFSVAFVHEAVCGDTLQLFVDETDERILVHAVNGDTTCFIAEVRK